ncbi:DUF4397 domain-containing protein [Roseateles violae]|uniref:DUF4397 domain-containing protein n=1 Tax=Roseateles violae TaxID=3058042 RepID=A0ABT8DTF4_9BURK|nr:DUF4397 domain-containing protein [Pelomonas sp. PFR6]MDN3921351.1 DUF4397 domain-containing protein [Pelomonas sp. PFR6]
MQLLKYLTAAAAALLVAACGGGDTEDRLDVRDPVVRFIHAVPAGPNLSLYRNETADPPSNVAYKSVSRYYDVSNSAADWSVRLASAPSTALSTTRLNPSQGDRYTFVALLGANGSAVGLTAIHDPYNKGLLSDKARVRVLHADPLAPAVDVYLIQPAQDLAQATPTISNLSYSNVQPASGNDSLEVNGGTFRLVLTTAGSKAVVFNAPSVSIANNADWLLLAIPGPSGLPGDVRVLVAQGNDTQDGQTLELVSQ